MLKGKKLTYIKLLKTLKMSNLTENTELELMKLQERFTRLQNELIRLKQWDMAIELGEVYYKSKTESYAAGMYFMKEINEL